MRYEHSRSTYSDLAGGETAVHEHISDIAFLGQILRFERALAKSALACGVITPAQHDDAIAAIDAYEPDLEQIAVLSAEGANPAIPIARHLKSNLTDPSGIHVGATSQDAIDSALGLCIIAASEPLYDGADRLIALLRSLAEVHRGTEMIGRTLGQQATPTTFGCVAAGWMEQLQMSVDDLKRAVAQIPVQYAGATGTLAAVHPQGIALHDALADELGMQPRPLVWHTNRLPFIRVSGALAEVAGACRKIASDIIFLSASEIGEVREASPGGSSSMPHKANPAAAIAADGYARRAPGLHVTMLDAMDCRLQRGVGSWHAEWATLRELFAVTASTLSRTTASLFGLRVNTEKMASHLNHTATIGHATDIVDEILNDERTT
ncbi:3-carboxy-cis,cis-muconate cycloisomerase [Corynebacterium hadale]|uniref:3-carboxy-cis,cis-muconate cycloisomerase n=1 Tax=Corynebacterium hadale TaxID=2026255 RepID=A0AB36RKX1_9CORY|nr:lyase family protein [Corynebacterium hadale]PAT09794.1 3-carboxy-cis,cis-muconate cycloisomerase [Corynebacterium hadale]